MRSPADVQRAQTRTETHRKRTAADPIGDKLRTGEKIQQGIVQDESCRSIYTVPIIIPVRGGQLAPDELRRMKAKPGED